MSAFKLDSSAPLLGAAAKRIDKVLPSDPPPVASPTNLPISRESVFIADNSAGADLLGVAEALQPVAQLCSHADTQTPLMIALVGAAGSGKSFALARLTGAVGDLSAAGASAKGAGGPFLSPIVSIPLDAAQLAGDPASAIATATFQTLSREYPVLAAEAAQAGADPAQAASMAAARHDEIHRKLDAEREARDEVDGRRARLSESVLYQTPGSRIDAFARSSRGPIESRLRRFDLLAGDPIANFKDLVRDFSGAGAGSRVSIALRSIWGYRSQLKLLVWVFVSFALAYGVSKLASLSASPSPRGLGAAFDAVGDWLGAHHDWLDKAVAGFIVIGALLLFANFWRALSFSATLFRGLRLLNSDVRDRRRELDSSSARLNQRVAALSAEADAAAKHAEAAAKRVRGEAKAAVASPSPLFTLAQTPPAVAARAFMAELGRLIAAPPAAATAPRRLVLAIDNLDALPPDQALNVIETAHGMLGASCIGVAAFNPATLASAAANRDALRERLERLFQITFNVQGADSTEQARMVARLLGISGADRLGDLGGAAPTSIAEPLSAAEATLLTALAPLACSTPRRAKRYLNLYRLARTSHVSRPAVALMLAVTLSEDRRLFLEMERLLREPDAALVDPKGPPALIDAVQATRAASTGRITNLDALLAMDVAQRYRLAM